MCSAWAASCACATANARRSTSSSPRAPTKASPASDGETTLLTVEHIRVRRRRGEVHVVPLSGVAVDDARALCDAAGEVAKAAVGQTRAALVENLRALPGNEDDARLRRAIEKLVTDAC